MKIVHEAPVERTPVAAGQHGVLWRLGVDQQGVGDAFVGLRGGEVGARRDADRLHGRAGETLADLSHSRRRFAPMQLHEVGRQRVHDALQRVVVSVDAERNDFARP